MSISLILFLTVGLLLIVLGFLVRRDGKKSSDAKNHGYGLIAIYLGFYFLIIGASHTFLHKQAWTDDSKQLFLLILSGSTGFFALLFGIGMLLSSLKGGSKIGTLSAALWSVGAIGISFVVISKISKMNEGWTKENRNEIKNRCESKGDYDCDCQISYIIKKYPNKVDYNEKMGNETKYKDKSIMEEYLKKNCLKCDSLKMQRETQKIGEGNQGLPADF